MREVAAGRIPCVNPRCRRTAAATKFSPAAEIICGKCFRLVPMLRARYRALKRRDQRLQRLIAKRKAHGTINAVIVNRVGDRMYDQMEKNWSDIMRYFISPEKPIGLEGFLQDMRL